MSSQRSAGQAQRAGLVCEYLDHQRGVSETALLREVAMLEADHDAFVAEVRAAWLDESCRLDERRQHEVSAVEEQKGALDIKKGIVKRAILSGLEWSSTGAEAAPMSSKQIARRFNRGSSHS